MRLFFYCDVMHSRNKSYIYKALFEKKKDNFKSYSCLLFKILDNQ